MTEKCEGGGDDAGGDDAGGDDDGGGQKGVVCGTDEDKIEQLDVPLGKDLKFGCKDGCIKLKKVYPLVLN